MPRLEPFTGWVVAPAHANRVVIPPFDSLSQAERRAGRADPDSFLGVLPPRPLTGEVLEDCRRHLDRLLSTGRFEQLEGPALAVLELDDGRGPVTGVVGDVAASAFSDGSIAPHEQVRPASVTALRRHLEIVGAVSSPVCVAHEPDDRLRELADEVTRHPPRVELTDAAGSLRLWVVTDDAVRDDLAARVGATSAWVVADGHHRAAAARPIGRVLSVLVPADELEVRPFHRRVRTDDPAGAGDRLRDHGLDVEELSGPARPVGAGEVTLAGGGRWWRVQLPPTTPGSPAAQNLDLVRAEHDVLAVLLGSTGDDSTAEIDASRVTAVAPGRELSTLLGDGEVTIVLHPPGWDEVRAVVEAGATMPPKSTYVAPKQRSGVLVVPRGQRLPSTGR